MAVIAYNQPDRLYTLLNEAATTATVTGNSFRLPRRSSGFLLAVSVSILDRSQADETLTVKIQFLDPVGGIWSDLKDAAQTLVVTTAALTATGTVWLQCYPGVTTTANKAFSVATGGLAIRAIGTVGGTSPGPNTYTVAAIVQD